MNQFDFPFFLDLIGWPNACVPDNAINYILACKPSEGFSVFNLVARYDKDTKILKINSEYGMVHFIAEHEAESVVVVASLSEHEYNIIKAFYVKVKLKVT